MNMVEYFKPKPQFIAKFWKQSLMNIEVMCVISKKFNLLPQAYHNIIKIDTR